VSRGPSTTRARDLQVRPASTGNGEGIRLAWLHGSPRITHDARAKPVRAARALPKRSEASRSAAIPTQPM
jgi:hypothetical protein